MLRQACLTSNVMRFTFKAASHLCSLRDLVCQCVQIVYLNSVNQDLITSLNSEYFNSKITGQVLSLRVSSHFRFSYHGLLMLRLQAGTTCPLKGSNACKCHTESGPSLLSLQTLTLPSFYFWNKVSCTPGWSLYFLCSRQCS